MLDKVSLFKDKDGFTYKHPERNCSECCKYPCVPNMDKLLSNFAAYGCINYDTGFNVRHK